LQLTPLAPVTLGEFAGLMASVGGFEPRPLLAVAVSGGPDSLALAILADRWARDRGGETWALHVDHGLRPESAAEAKSVAGWLAARGIAHETLVWTGGKPATGIQQAARTARYGLLETWCRARGCLHLLTAHQRDDQAETYLIRRRAKSGVDGLAGIAAVREVAGLRLVRPLLAVPSARLAALLDAEGQDHLCDPSNRNPAFERARLRLAVSPDTVLAALAEQGASATARMKRERALAELLARSVMLHPGGFALIDPAPVAAAGELGERALDRIAAVIGGGAYPLRRERLARLRAALGATPLRARTLGGCRFVPWRGCVLAIREAARAAPPVRLEPDETAIWDRRFRATLPRGADPLWLGLLGADGVATAGRGPKTAGNPLPRLVYPVLPALRDARGLVAVPHLDYHRRGDKPPNIAFSPPSPMCGSGFTVV
jgi:tRNA(Ile)-lysidine synthase